MIGKLGVTSEILFNINLFTSKSPLVTGVLSGLIFFITPTGQFLLGFFYYNEEFSLNKLISFIIIWIAVSIYLKDLYEDS